MSLIKKFLKIMSWNKASFVQKLVSSSFCSIAIDDKLVELTPFKKDYMNICQTPDLKIKIHQVYKNDIGNSDSPDRELFFILNQESYQSKILKFIFNGNEINLNIEDENDQNILNSDFKDTLKRKFIYMIKHFFSIFISHSCFNHC